MQIARSLSMASALLLAGCASSPVYVAREDACDISALNSGDYSHDTWCFIEHAANRCSTKSDKCLVNCELSGGGANVGGGCSHICYPPHYTDQDVTDNGGDFYPKEAIACVNAAAP